MLKFTAFRKTIFVRLVILHIVVILPVLMLGMYLYNWSYSNASRDLSKATMAQLNDYLGDLNREMEWMENQQFAILEDRDLNKLAVAWEMMDNVERRANLNRLVNRLTTIKNSSAYIRDIEVHIRSINRSVSATNAVYEFDEDSFRFLGSIRYQQEQRLILWRDTLNLSVAKQSGVKSEEPLFIVQIELDSQSMRESLRQLNIYPQSHSFLLAEAANFTLGSDTETELMLQSNLAEFQDIEDNSTSWEIEGRTYHLDRAYSESLALSVATYLPEEVVRRPLSKFQLWAWLFALTSMGAIVLYSYSTYLFVHKPLLLLVRSFRRMEGGSLDIQIKHDKNDEFGYLYTRFNHMVGKLQTLIDQDFKQKLMMQKAELKQLQSQINPHFLYNSFFILNSLAKVGDVERIEQFTKMLGEYFRFITRNGEDKVKLADEIKHSRMYTEIQKLRFSRRIHVRFDELPQDLENLRVPRLILQPIIENAYQHSLEKMAEEGELCITFEHDPDEARIIVEDNGNEISDADIAQLQERMAYPKPTEEITGMINIHRRIVLVYGEESGLVLSRSKLNGMKVTMRIRLGKEAGE